jgi:hypothetical protein
MTAVAYILAGLFTRPSFELVPWIVPTVAIGVPLGAQLIQRLRPETFRRICMSFDAWVVAFGLSKLVHDLAILQGGQAYFILLGVVMLDGWLLYRFFSVREMLEEAAARQGPAGYVGTEAVQPD